MPAEYEQNENARFKEIFRLWVGSFGTAPNGKPKMTVEELAVRTGVKPNTVKHHHKHDGGMPTVPTLKLYMKALPVQFASAFFFDCGFELDVAEEHETPNGHELVADLTTTVAHLADDLRDMEHTDDEKVAIAPRLEALGSTLVTTAGEWRRAKTRHLKAAV